ncbi:MAG: glutathione S-transferase family protein [Magnetovibrio sp.]|nr:glutathione S-transferase family protein [Magnetovibrio sp.]
MLQLHYFPDNASLAPHFLLIETNAEYELKLVDRDSNAQKSEDYLKLNPAGRIPTLVHDDLVLFESPAICIYICELDADSRFIPPLGESNRALFFQWMAYLSNTLQAEFMLWRYPENHTTDATDVERIKAAQDTRLGDILALLDEQLGRNRFLVSDTVGACDHFLFMLALWCGRISRPPALFSNLRRFMREMAQRPAIQRACEIENIDLGPYVR